MKTKNQVVKAQAAKIPPKPRKQNTEFEKGFWNKQIIPALIIFISGLGLYLSTVSFEYILDDSIVVTDNVYTNAGFAGIRKIFSEESFTGYFQKQEDLVAGSRYRPLSIATFAVEMEFFKTPKQDGYGNLSKDAKGNQLMSGNPAISHFINALLYAITGLILFRLLCILFPSSENSKWFFSIPFAATMLFMVHPLHTEVVANIKGRDEILSLLFSLSSLYYLFRYLNSQKIFMLLMCSFCYFLALLSKENAITFLVIIPLTIYFFTQTKRATIVQATLPLLIVTTLYMIIRYRAVGYFISDNVITDIMNNPFYGMSFAQKMATIIYTLGLYVKLLFIPEPLTHDYYPYAIPVMDFGQWQTILSVVLYLVLIVISVKGIAKKNPVSYCILFFLITLSIVSNLVLPVGSFMNERFAYMSSVGFCIAIAYLFLEKLPSVLMKNLPVIKYVSLAVIGVVALLFSAKTVARIPAWKNHYQLNDADIITSANSCRANCFMGVGLYQKYLHAKTDDEKKKLIFDADKYLRKSLKIYPTYGAAHQMLSGVMTEEFKFHKDIDSLLNGFYFILEYKDNLDYIDQYLNWLNRQQVYNKNLIKFYHRAGYELLFKQKQNRDKAKKYIQMGLQLDATDSLLQNDLKEMNNAGPF